MGTGANKECAAIARRLFLRSTLCVGDTTRLRKPATSQTEVVNSNTMDKTLIILGAGASKDFCRIFPTGLELIKDINYHFLNERNAEEIQNTNGIYLSALTNQIAGTLGNDEGLFRQIKKQLWDIQLHYEWKSLRNNTDEPVSIDNFIYKQIKEGKLNAKAENIVKYSIYYLIKGTEQAYAEGNYDPKKNWISELAEKLSKVDFNNIIENLTIITFNYDRTFERYFTDYSNNYRSLSSEQVSRFHDNIKHVYDSLGRLNEIPFNLPNNKVDIIKGNYQRIKLIDDRNEIELAITEADKYRKVHFIGFGYDETNMKLIRPGQFTSASLNGTAYYYTPTQITDLKVKYNIDAKDISCTDYVKSITL